ncbi:MAG: FG-GAP-like repeat-containing protein, partial [Elusimicrobiota bacterium]
MSIRWRQITSHGGRTISSLFFSFLRFRISFLKNISAKFIKPVELFSLFLFLFSPLVYSATLTWDGGGADNNFNTPANWSSDVNPGVSDDVEFDGTSNKACTINVSTTILSFSIKSGSTITITQSATLVVTNTMSISAGTFNAGSNLLTVGGNWSRTGVGIFNANSSTVIFNSATTQTLTGSTTFYGIRALTSGATLQFSNGTTSYATNMVDFKNISLRSVTNGATAYFQYTGSSQTLRNLMVRDINSSGGTLMNAPGSTDLGNNTNWNFIAFSPNQIEVDGVDGGTSLGTSSFGDFDNDGDLDILVVGEDATSYQLRVYRSNGNGTFDPTEIDVDGAAGGMRFASAAWGDFDNDNDLDILTAGFDFSSNRRLSVYLNNGNGTFDATQVEVDGVGGGVVYAAVAAGDFDNDGDLDVLASGADTSGRQLRVYRNNGNGTFDGNQIEVIAADSGFESGTVSWGDFDRDGDLDVLALGLEGFNRQLRVYKNLGNGSFDATPVELEAADSGLSNASATWGDFDNDGDLDVLCSGYDGLTPHTRVYRNNGNGTFNSSEISIGTLGLQGGGTAWGDYDNDGDLDILVSGIDDNGSQLFIYNNNGNGTFASSGIAVEDTANAGLQYGSVSWGDVDNDGDLDILANGSSGGGRQLRVYLSSVSLSGGGNTAPSAPSGISSSFQYAVNRSTLTFKWDAGAYDTGYSSNSIYFNLWMGTNTLPSSPPATFEKTIITPRQGSPLFGNYLRPAYQTWPGDGSAKFGVYYSTTPNIATNAFDTDTSYYWRIQTIDAGLKESAWSSQNVARTDVAPNAVTNLSALTGSSDGEINLTWTSPGDDQSTGNLNPGTFRIFYSTVSGDMTGLSATTSTTTTLGQVNISTSGVTPGSTRSRIVTGLISGGTYYIRVFTGDEVPNWSSISNGATAFSLGDITTPAAVTNLTSLSIGGYIRLSWASPGDDNLTSNLNPGTFRIFYSTVSGDMSALTATTSTTTTLAKVDIATSAVTPGSTQLSTLSGLLGAGSTYYIRVFTADEIPNWSGISNGATGYMQSEFDSAPVEIEAIDDGMYDGKVAWGDFDKDGDLDVLVSGRASTPRQLRVYKNNGNGTFDNTQIEIDGLGGGLIRGSVSWGDFDNDGDLDIVAIGQGTNNSPQLRVYKNNGDGTFDSSQIEVDGAGSGLVDSSVSWGDYDNDGDLDLLASGADYNAYGQLRVYTNNRNGVFNSFNVDGINGGFTSGEVAWGDFDNDGDLDILANGTVSDPELRVYRNNGNGSFDASQIDVDGPAGGLTVGSVAWGDFDSDGDLDILTNGIDSSFYQLRVYKNNGNGSFDSTQIEVDGNKGGLGGGNVAWGDFDNDGDLDIVINGVDNTNNNQLRVYKNNGNGTFNNAQIEVAGVNGGLNYGGVAWGDFDNDGDLDILTNGVDNLFNRQLRVYQNKMAQIVSNGTPSPPTGLSVSTSTTGTLLQWNTGSDGSFSNNSLSYNIRVSTFSNSSTSTVVASIYGTPLFGNYIRPKLSNAQLGERLRLAGGVTYYWTVQTIDSSLSASAFATEQSTFVPAIVPNAVSDLVASTGTQIRLTWTAPYPVASTYIVRYSTTGAIVSDADFSTATTVAVSAAMSGAQQVSISGLVPGTTYWFAIKSSNSAGTSAIDTSSPEPFAVAGNFYGVDVDGSGGGLYHGVIAVGDIDNDGDNDIVINGKDISDNPQLRLYKNNGNGTFDNAQTEIDGLNGGLHTSSVALGDYDNDGDLDILVTGLDASFSNQFRIYKNNGDGTFDSSQIEVETTNAGYYENGAVAWGDYDNDGDLDIVITGYDASFVRRVRVYKNNGNGTIDSTQIEVEFPLTDGVIRGDVAWGDYDNDGDLDILANGDNAGSVPDLRVYKNIGDGTFDFNQITVDAADNGLEYGGVAWGDYDNDGDLDILVSGISSGFQPQLRVYKNNGNGTFDATQIEVDGLNGGLSEGTVAWGDYDSDGDL